VTPPADVQIDSGSTRKVRAGDYPSRHASRLVAKLYISDRTAQKIVQIHRITPDEVREAVVGVVELRYVWSEDPERGERTIIETTIRGRRVLIVLYPRKSTMGDEWNLGSTYPVGS
jgi:hypothetical protein